MKKVVLLFVSLVPAAAIVLLLTQAGVLQFSREDGPDTAAESESKEVVRVPVVKENAPRAEGVETASSGPQPQAPPPVAVREGPMPGPASSSLSAHKPPSGGEEDPLLERALSFLSEKDEDPAGIEERFRKFLIEKAGLDEPRAERYLRMSFWKNFVTLQREWEPQEIKDLKASFAAEKALKKAGFAAKGLTLIASEMRDAEARFDAVLREMSSTGSKKEAP